MLTREEIHTVVDTLPEDELELVARLIEGLQATAPAAPKLRRRIGDPVNPPTPVPPANVYAPLASEYSASLMQEKPDQNMLRKVMFTPLRDLLGWVNQNETPSRS